MAKLCYSGERHIIQRLLDYDGAGLPVYSPER
jgi:hypothetical protein